MNLKRKLVIGLIWLATIVCTAVIVLVAGMLRLAPALFTIRSINLADELYTYSTTILSHKGGPNALVAISTADGPAPDKVVVDFVDPNTSQVLGTGTFNVQANQNGARFVDIQASDYGRPIDLNIRRPKA